MTGPVQERFLVTGAYGCIGAWVLRQLVDEGVDAVATDAGDDDHRLRDLLTDDERARLTLRKLDVTDAQAVDELFARLRPTHVVHLAALQVPFCAASPRRGALVNVVGTVNMFEAALQSETLTGSLVYASSIAAYAPETDGPPPLGPATHYGVYKRANEGNAGVYWNTAGLASIGLRPHVVYGVGRDQGLTSDPTKATVAAAVGQPFHIGYGGSTVMQYAPDVAAAFIASARTAAGGAHVLDLPGPSVDMREIVDVIHAVSGTSGLVTAEEKPLPFPPAVDPEPFARVVGSILETPLADGIKDTVDRVRLLSAASGQ
jgi:nucleoside-diphosphate-sugar epimerase